MESIPDFHPLPGVLPVRHPRVGRAQLAAMCQACRDRSGPLVTLWGEDCRAEGAGFALHVVLQQDKELLVAELPLPSENPGYHDLSSIFPNAARLQRAT